MGKRLIILGADFSQNGMFGGIPNITNPSEGDYNDTPSAGNNPNLPTGYTQLEYLESSGGAWINTNYFYSGGNWRLQTRFQRMDNSNAAFCGSQSGQQRTINIGQWDNNGGEGTYITIGTNPIYQGLLLARTSEPLIDIDLTCEDLVISGTSSGNNISKAFESNGAQSEYSYSIFAKNASNISSSEIMQARLYHFKLTVDDIPVLWLIPCINPSGIYGLYDKARGIFLSNAGNSGSFSGQ